MQLDKIGMGSPSFKTNELHESMQKTKQLANNKLSDQHEKIINKDKVNTVVSQLNGFIEPLRTNLQFKLHEELNEYYVTVVNPLTNEIIKEIPPKKMLDMYAAMAEYMGILIDEKI